MDFTPDILDRFATPRQREVIEAYRKHGSYRAAGDALGVHNRVVYQAIKAVESKAARAGYIGEQAIEVIPPGYKLKGTSTLYDGDGNARMRWVKTAEDPVQFEVMLEAMREVFADALPRVTPAPDPETTPDDFITLYPVGDHHFGMLAWGEETGAEDYDLDIGENLLCSAFDRLCESSMPVGECALIFLGDFMHYDSFESVTPTNKNQLDSDSRFPKIIRAALRSMRYMIARALGTHGHVHVIVAKGNHDPASSVWLAEALAAIYERETRLSVDTSPSDFHYLSFGQNLIGVHHGDGTKMERLPGIMAADRPGEWGASTHRRWLTGHIHQDSQKDFPGCSVESVRILPPPDAWAAKKGYRPLRDMKAIVLHKEFGEVMRLTVNPKMVMEQAA